MRLDSGVVASHTCPPTAAMSLALGLALRARLVSSRGALKERVRVCAVRVV